MWTWLGILTLVIGLAQPAEIPLRIVAITDEGIAFFEVSASGTREAVGEPLGNFAVESYDGSAEWMILAKESFAVSPDGSRIAFTAQRDDEAALFIYTIADGSLTQHPIVSYWLIPTWSPDSESVMLNVALPYWGDFPPPDDYVFVIATGSLFQITFTEEIEGVIHWSVDGRNVLYLGWCNPDNCGNPTRDIYLVSRDGATRFPLTDFPAQLPPGMSPSACFPTWSPEQERWYYAVGCGNFMQVDRSYIYSTDVNGNNRLEFSLEDYLRLAEGSDIKLDYGIAKGIHPRPEGIYISAEFSFFHDSDLHPDLAGITQYEWRVLRLATTGQLEAVYHQFAFTEASGSVMSPDGQRMVLTSFDSAFVIDVTDNQDIGEPPGLEVPGETAVCDVRWLDNETIVYNVGGHICRGVRYTSPQGARLMNVVTGEVTVLTEGLAGPAWVLPIPQFEQLAPPSLTADAGPDQALTADGSGFATVTLDGSGSFDPDGEIFSYVWTLDGVEIATGVSPTVTLEVGEHVITLTITDNDDATASDTVTITVVAASTPTATSTPTDTPTATLTPTYTPTPSQVCDFSIAAGDALGLVNAINAANNNGASQDTICLEESTYTFASASNAIALPSITTPITIVGNGAIIERGSGAPNFRLFNVTSSGALTLEDLTLRNGNASGNNGGAILNAMLSLHTNHINVAQSTIQNGKIAFASNRDGDFEIYIMDADGANVQQLTHNDTNDMWPSWSPDGSYIAFTSRRSGSNEIYVMNADGSNQVSLTPGETGYAPAWSPIGDKIAFTSDRGTGVADIYVMNVDGSNLVNLTATLDSQDELPAWTSDGGQIIFRTSREWDPLGRAEFYYDAYIMNADGSNQRKLMPAGYELSGVSMSPDGSRIVFGIDRDAPRIYVADADGSNSTILPPDSDIIGLDPRWSPEGDRILFSILTGSAEEIAVMNPDGSNLSYLTNSGGSNAHPAWQSVLIIEPTPTPTVTITPTDTPTATLTPTLTPTPSPTCTITVAAGDALGLVNAINAANGNGDSADTICLEDSTYTFFSANNAIALPSITTPITIVGNGATIERGSSAPDFRLFNVTSSGNNGVPVNASGVPVLYVDVRALLLMLLGM